MPRARRRPAADEPLAVRARARTSSRSCRPSRSRFPRIWPPCRRPRRAARTGPTPTPRADAIAALGGNAAGRAAGHRAASSPIPTRFGVDPRDPRGRSRPRIWNSAGSNDGRLLERVFNVNVYFSAYAPLSLDQYAELDRFRRPGSAPQRAARPGSSEQRRVTTGVGLLEPRDATVGLNTDTSEECTDGPAERASCRPACLALLPAPLRRGGRGHDLHARQRHGGRGDRGSPRAGRRAHGLVPGRRRRRAAGQVGHRAFPRTPDVQGHRDAGLGRVLATSSRPTAAPTTPSPPRTTPATSSASPPTGWT